MKRVATIENHGQLYIKKKKKNLIPPIGFTCYNVHDDDFGKLRYTCTCSSFIHLVGGVKYLAYKRIFSLFSIYAVTETKRKDALIEMICRGPTDGVGAPPGQER